MTPDEQMFRRMGYFRDQRGIIRRCRREQEQWEAHLQNTRQFAVQSMQGRNCGSAAVLGSGWLLDVPLDELSRSFGKVYLYDVRHPEAAKRQAKALGNVELRVCDISCFARPVYRYAKLYRNRRERPPISGIRPDTMLDLNGFDFVFSCNILNQLDILLTDYLSRYFELSNEETLAFRTGVQHHHIGQLPPNHSCIVADYEEILYTSEGKELSRTMSVYHSLVLHPDAKRWIWQFDTRMTYHKGRKTCFKVFGMVI